MRAVGIAFVLAIAATPVRAEVDQSALAEAMRLENALEHDAALVIVERLIAQGTAEPDQLVMLHLFAGRLAAGLERTQVAEDHFARVLAIEPTTKFVEDMSPKITEPFDAARARTVPLRVTANLDRGVVTITAAADPLGLVAGIAVKLADGSELRERRGRRVELPDGARVVEVSALDAFGNRVWTRRGELTGNVGPGPLVDSKPPLYKRWTLWTGTSMVLLAAGGVCAWRFDSAQNEWQQQKEAGMTDFSELQQIERRGRRWALAANIGFGAAAATGIIAIVAAAAGASPSTRGMVTATPDAVGFAIASDF